MIFLRHEPADALMSYKPILSGYLIFLCRAYGIICRGSRLFLIAVIFLLCACLCCLIRTASLGNCRSLWNVMICLGRLLSVRVRVLSIANFMVLIVLLCIATLLLVEVGLHILDYLWDAWLQDSSCIVLLMLISCAGTICTVSQTNLSAFIFQLLY